MRTIWKYEVLPGRFSVEMPTGAEVLSAQVQWDRVCMWVLVDDDEPPQFRAFVSVGTGHEVPLDAGRHVDTWQADGLVWHLFEVPR